MFTHTNNSQSAIGDDYLVFEDIIFDNQVYDDDIEQDNNSNNYVLLRNTLEYYNTNTNFTKGEVFSFLNSYEINTEFENTLDDFMDELIMNSRRHNLYVILCEYCREILGYDINYGLILQFRNTCHNVRISLQQKIIEEQEKIKNELTINHDMSNINGIKSLISQYVI